MPDRPFDAAAAWNGIRGTLSEIRTQRREFHASVLETLNKMEQMSNELLAHEESSPPQEAGVDQQIDHLSTLVVELTNSLKSHKQMLAEERSSWIKDIRCMQVQQQPKHSNLGHRNERGKH
jgi:phage-related tail protein